MSLRRFLPLFLRERLLSPVFNALQAKDFALVDQLIAKRKHLHASNEWGFTPLMIAIRDGHSDLALRMLDLGASAKTIAMVGATPLGVAAMAGSTEVGLALLRHGADPNFKETDPDGTTKDMTALMWAANRRHPAFIKLLLDHGANINQMNGSKQTALMFASEGTPESNVVLEVLLQREPDISIRDWRGRSIVDEANARSKNSGKHEMKELLAKYFPGSVA